MTRLQRFDRMSWWIPVCAFCWGALVAPGFGTGLLALFGDVIPAYSFTGDASIPAIDAWLHQIFVGQLFTGGFIEELGKGAGIVAICALLRHRLTGVVSGIVIGASVGLGFNFSETLLYLGQSQQAGDVFQLWARQGISLMGGHLAFSAVVGAGVGLALQLERRRDKVAAIGAGYLLASCCHLATNFLLSHLNESRGVWLPEDEASYVLLVIPVFIVVMHGPLTVLYLLMARSGLKLQAKGLAEELVRESASGYGAVTPTEVAVLLSPRRRFRRKLLELVRHGLTAHRRLDRLYAAQLRLGTQRWLAARGDPHASATIADDLRVRAVKTKLAILGKTATDQPHTTETRSMAEVGQ